MQTKNDHLINTNPKTGEELSRHRIADQEEIKLAFNKSLEAQNNWAKNSPAQRIPLLKELREKLADNRQEIIDIICKDTGKVEQEALTADLIPVLRILKYYEKNASKILSRQKRSTPFLAFNNYSYVEYFPRGIIAVISPWNYPLQLAVVPAITALAAGNSVLLKPSEITPLVGKYIAEIFSSLNSGPDNLLQVLQGGGNVGSQIISQNPDMIFFTGSCATGKKIMRQASSNLIPVELELGGKDPLIVFDDANIARAAGGAVYGAFTNTGQLCVSVERAYVQENSADEFIKMVEKKTKSISWKPESPKRDIGPFTHPDQQKKVKNLINDALDQGANLIGSLPPKNSESYFFPPLILTDVDHNMKIMQEEIFGPVLPIMTFQHEEEAIELANDSKFGLNSSIWSEDKGKARRLAGELEAGNVIINDVIRNVGNPSLPFGGVKASGMGRYHGPEGLKNFSNTRSIMVNNNKSAREINWFPFSAKLNKNLAAFLEVFYGTASLFKNITSVLALLILFLKNTFLEQGDKDV